MPSLLLFPFHLLCPPWPGPLSSSLASQCLGSLKMLITPGFLLVPRIFLFIKPGQTLPRGGTHTRAGTLSNPRGCFSFPFLISIPGPFFFLSFLVLLYVLYCFWMNWFSWLCLLSGLSADPVQPQRGAESLTLTLERRFRFFLSFFFLMTVPQHIEVPGPGIESEMQLQPMPQLQQCCILYPT